TQSSYISLFVSMPKTAYEFFPCLEFRRVLFRSRSERAVGAPGPPAADRPRTRAPAGGAAGLYPERSRLHRIPVAHAGARRQRHQIGRASCRKTAEPSTVSAERRTCKLGR